MIYDIRALHDIIEDNNLWGGKATGLYKLNKYGFQVPKTLVISSEVYLDYKENKLDITKFANNVNSILNSDFFDNSSTDLILRSSANIEGTKDFSCCGVFSSYVFDTSIGLYENIKQVWDSTNTKSAKSYFDFMSISIENLRMSVIIQEIKIGIISGVVQTYDLINEVEHIIIEYELGSINAVVDGNTNSNLLIADRQGNIIESTSPDNSYLPQLKQLVLQCIKIEHIFSSPVEIEFQLFSNNIYFIQVRELT